MNLRRVQALANKELIQILRDPRSLGLAIVIPIILLTLFGFALTMDVDNVPMVIWNQDNSQVSKDFLFNFKFSRYFDIIGYFDNYKELQWHLDKSKASMALIIPKDFSKYIGSNDKAPLQLLVDGSDSNSATIAMGYVNSIVARYNIKFIKDALAFVTTQDPSPVDLRPRIWFNEDLESRNYIIPGLIAIILMIITAALAALTVAKEWERGTMEQLISTPVRAGELIFGKFIPYFIIGFADLLIAVMMSKYVFNVPLRGNVFLLIGLSVIFLTGALCLGIYISVVAKNQRLASQLANLATFMPAFLLAGFVYPISNMPKFIQWITYFVPAKYFIMILRGIYLKGIGLKILWGETIFLTVFSAWMIMLAVTKFKKKIE